MFVKKFVCHHFIEIFITFYYQHHIFCTLSLIRIRTVTLSWVIVKVDFSIVMVDLGLDIRDEKDQEKKRMNRGRSYKTFTFFIFQFSLFILHVCYIQNKMTQLNSKNGNILSLRRSKFYRIGSTLHVQRKKALHLPGSVIQKTKQLQRKQRVQN